MPLGPMSRGPVVLSSQDDYRIWLNQVEVFAKSRAVWEYVDPASRHPMTISEPPAPRFTDVRASAGRLADLSNDELARWILLNSNHDDTMQRYEKIRSRLGEVHMEIIHTVSRQNQQYLIGRGGPRDAILRLTEEYGPGGTQTTSPPRDISSCWKQLQMNPPTATDDIDAWLGKWHFLYREGKTFGIQEVQEKRPLLAFLYAVDFIAPKFAFYWDCKIEEDTSVDLPRLLREFRTWKQQHPDLLSLHKEQPEENEIEVPSPPVSSGQGMGNVQSRNQKKQPAKALDELDTSHPAQNDHVQQKKPNKKRNKAPKKPRPKSTTSSSTQNNVLPNAPEKHPGETVTKISTSPPPVVHVSKNKSKKPFKRNPGPKDDCLCSRRHFFSDCPYVVEALRPSVWAQDPVIRAKFDEMMQISPEFKHAVQKATENGNRKHRDSNPFPVPDVKRAIVLTTLSSDRTFRSAFALTDSFLITESANVHVCNDRSRFVDFWPADDRLKSHASKEFRILGYGTVDLRPAPISPCRGPLMTLRNVAYAPDFMNNVVSLGLAVGSGHYCDTVGQMIGTKEGKPTWKTAMHSEFCVVEYNPLPPAVLQELAEESEDSGDLEEPLSPDELEHPFSIAMGHPKWVPVRAGSESDFDGMDWIDPHAPLFR